MRTEKSESKDPAGTDYPRRGEFLISMYEQLMGDINRHIVVVWQMVGVLAAAVAAMFLAEKQGVPAAYGVVLVIVVGCWVIEHLYDSNFWYNRNLVMITNIERVFLTSDDIDLIHPYFSSHRNVGSFLSHLKIQLQYTRLIVLLSMTYFTLHDVLPTFDTQASINWIKIIPYPLYAALMLRDQTRKRFYERKYSQYLSISPGITMGRDVDFGTTHGKQ